MEYLFEFVLELIFDMSVEASKSKKVPRWLRYLLIALISLFVLATIGIVIAAGIIVMNGSVILGVLILAVAAVLLALAIFKFRKVYTVKRSERDAEKEEERND